MPSLNVSDCAGMVPKMVTLSDNLERTESTLNNINKVISEIRAKFQGPMPCAECGDEAKRPKPGILEQAEINMIHAEAIFKDLSELGERL